MSLIKAPKTYSPVGQCIYCGVPAELSGPKGLSDEHIIPYSFGGNLTLPGASCCYCADETHAFEGKVAGSHFEALRTHVHWRSRKRKRPTTLPVNSPNAGVRIPIDVHPPAFAFFKLKSLPNLLKAKPLVSSDGVGADVIVKFASGSVGRLNQLHRHNAKFMLPLSSPNAFFRTIAKIAHSYAVAECGINSVDYILREMILGSGTQQQMTFENYIGNENTSVKRPGVLHHLSRRWVRDLLIIEVQLYALIGAPSYFVCVGRKRPEVISN